MQDRDLGRTNNRESVEEPSRLNVVIAEDDQSVTRLLRAIFMDSGDVTFFTSAEDALAALRTRKEQKIPVDLLITDVGLKGDRNGGFVLAEAVAAGNLSPTVFFLTGNPDNVLSRYSQEQRKEMGVERVIGKPVRPSELMKLVGEVKKRKQDS